MSAKEPTTNAADASAAPDRDKAPRRRNRGIRRGTNWGARVARALCLVFGLVGLLPLTLGGLSRIDAVQQWVSNETASILRDQLNLEATYELELQPWPPRLMLRDLNIAASDGGSPFIEADEVIATPRIFSLLAGHMNLGDVQIEQPRVRAVIRKGKLANLTLKTPKAQSDEPPGRPPLRSISITNANVVIDAPETRVRSSAIDLDINLERGPVDIFLRAGQSEVDRDRQGSTDEDRICHSEIRAQWSPEAHRLLVRRLHLEAVTDFDGRTNTRPSCKLPKEDWRHLEVQLANVEATLRDGGLKRLNGRARGRLPVPLVHRLFDVSPTTGWVGFELDELAYRADATLPTIKGRITGAEIGIAGKYIARTLDTALHLEGENLKVSDLALGWGGGLARIEKVTLAPLDPTLPLQASGIEIDDIRIEDLLNDLGGLPRAYVTWLLDEVSVPRFGGTLSPLALSGPMDVQSRDFVVYDRAYHQPLKRKMMGLKKARIAGQFKVTEEAIVLAGFDITTPGAKTRMLTTVSLGYESLLGINITEGARIDLSELSPIADIPLAGEATLTVVGGGPFNDPQLRGSVAIDNFRFADFDIGTLTGGNFQFAPVRLLVENLQLQKRQSLIAVPQFDVDFGPPLARVKVSARVDTRRGAGCAGGCRLSLDDFYHTVKLDRDPRFASYKVANIEGVNKVDYVLGGPEDTCRTGRLSVQSQLRLHDADLLGERFEKGTVDFNFIWDDLLAGGRGMYADIHSAVLHRGTGTLMGRAAIRHGGKLQADLTGSAISIDTFTAYQKAYGMRARSAGDVRPEAAVSFVGSVSGSLERIRGQFDMDVSALRIGPTSLPPSRFRLNWMPSELPMASTGKSHCGNAIPPVTTASDAQSLDQAGRAEELFSLSGSLFGQQVKFTDLRILRQKTNVVSGRVDLSDLDLGALANLVPGVAFTSQPPVGRLSGAVFIDEIDLDAPTLAEMRIRLDEAEIARKGDVYRISQVDRPFRLSGDVLSIPPFTAQAKFKGALPVSLVTSGSITGLSRDPELSIDAKLTPVDLAKLGLDIAALNRASGLVTGGVTIGGTWSRPDFTGLINLSKATLSLRDLPIVASNVEVTIALRGDEITIEKADATIGSSGQASIRGRANRSGTSVESASLALTARNVKLPVADGINVTTDAGLQIEYEAGREGQERRLPRVTGNVTIDNFSYTRPMRFSVDLDQLTSAKRTNVDEYNPKDDFMTFDIGLQAPRSLRISNNLVDMRMKLDEPGLRLAGTNQRYGARGSLSLDRGSKLYVQGHRFDVRDGRITFDNPNRISPKLDIRAVTEYRRYASTAELDSSSTAVDGASANTAGTWRIAMHASGDTDEPKLRFTSEPALQQHDIILLLQVGMTRAELDSSLGSSLAQTVGLEALSAAAGFDQAVKSTLPLIDEFRIGNQYSSKTGRPEPTLSVGKRLTEDVRARVTTGLSANRELRSNIEWKLKRGISLEGLYENVDDVSSSALGNVGADLRWRLEFD